MVANDNKEILFGIDFNIDSTIYIEVKHKKSRTFIKPGDKYPVLFKGITRENFSSWNLSHLQEFLADRSINKTGDKDTVVRNSYKAYKMNFKIRVTEYMEEKNEVEMNLQSTLVLENELVSSLDPSKLIDGWFSAPYKLPNLIYEQVNTYLKDIDAGKTFKGGSLLVSGYIKNMMPHSISSNIS